MFPVNAVSVEFSIFKLLQSEIMSSALVFFKQKPYDNLCNHQGRHRVFIQRYSKGAYGVVVGLRTKSPGGEALSLSACLMKVFSANLTIEL